MDAISTALVGMTGGYARFDRAASNLVESTSGVSDASPETAMVDLMPARTQARANAAVMRAADDMLGSLMDIRV
jgi:hypothetical protein